MKEEEKKMIEKENAQEDEGETNKDLFNLYKLFE